MPTFILTPLIYLGGVFYSVDMLPGFWKLVAQINPVFYMINAFRYGILGISDSHLGFSLFMLVAFTVSMFGFSLWLLHRGKGLRH